MRQNPEKRDLSLVRRSGSTTRVLNLPLVCERYGQTPEYSERPLFHNKRLNRAIIIRHVLRGSEFDLFKTRRPVATKITLPFSLNDLRLGGETFFIDQVGYERILRESCGSYGANEEAVADRQILRLIDELPSLDPFLLRERLRRVNRAPARCYFDVSQADLEHMSEFVTREMTQLVLLAFQGLPMEQASPLAAKLAEKLMTDETAAALDPLRQTLRLSGEEYREGVFAWKGLLYYKWRLSSMRAGFQPLFKSMLNVRLTNQQKHEMERLVQSRQNVIEAFSQHACVADDLIADYDRALQSMTGTGSAAGFRQFLLGAPQKFATAGQSFGAIAHIESFWKFRFALGDPLVIETNEAVEIFAEFETTLRGLSMERAR